MGTHPIFESDFDCLTDFDPKSPGGMASPLAVLSEAAYVYEQMEQLKMDQLSTPPYAHEPVASVPNPAGAGGAAGAAPGGLPWVLVVPHPGLAHAQAMQALQAMHTNAYLAAITQRAASAATTAAVNPVPKLNSPPRQLALHPAGSISTGSLSTESEGYPPWHQQQQQQQKPEVIVRNPNHHQHHHHQVRMRQKKPRPSVEAHFRRSLGSYETTTQQQNKRPSSMIEHSEVDAHFARVFGADEWSKLQAKRKKLNRHSVI